MLAAAAITVAILLVAFGTIGMLILVRTPQEPVVKLDPAPPAAMQQVETPQEVPQETPPLETATSIHEKTPGPVEAEQPDQKIEAESKDEIEKRTVKTFRVLAPPAATAEPNETVAEEKKPEAEAKAEAKSEPEPEPETTATIPQPQAKTKRPPRRAQQRPVRKRQAVRRAVPNTKSENPFLQLFGIKKYR